MTGAINFYKQAGAQDDLVAGFLTELQALEDGTVQTAPGFTTADLVGLVVKCAEQLEESSLDASAADEALRFIETELL